VYSEQQVHITEFRVPASGAAVGEFAVRAVCRGEPFDRHRHESGTEVKAITYSNMQIHNPHPETKLYELFVVIDI
jgi:SHS2 domain-containing protein